MNEFNTPYNKFRVFFVKKIGILRYLYFKVLGYDFHKTTIIERRCNFDRINPGGIHIGEGTIVASQVTILSHKLIPEIFMDKGKKKIFWASIKSDVFIGSNCLIGINAMIMPGVKIGDFCVIGAGSIIKDDVPSYSIVSMGVKQINFKMDITDNFFVPL